jgi:rfaE bifunctional protein nucleotidyltransferase chain/domain
MKNVWTNGCFDIVHLGHLALFQYAKSLGDNLIVGVDCDARVKQRKGSHRPIHSQEQRIEFLKHIKHIDKILLFDSNLSLKEHIKNNNIDTIVVGDDYKDQEVIGSELVNTVKFFPKLSNFSTSLIHESIR